LVTYYGYYSNRARGERRNKDKDTLLAPLLDPDQSSREARWNGSRLIRKIYTVESMSYES